MSGKPTTPALDDSDQLTLSEVRKLKQVAELYTFGNILAGVLVTLAAIGGALIGMYHAFINGKP